MVDLSMIVQFTTYELNSLQQENLGWCYGDIAIFGSYMHHYLQICLLSWPLSLPRAGDH